MFGMYKFLKLPSLTLNTLWLDPTQRKIVTLEIRNRNFQNSYSGIRNKPHNHFFFVFLSFQTIASEKVLHMSKMYNFNLCYSKKQEKLLNFELLSSVRTTYLHGLSRRYHKHLRQLPKLFPCMPNESLPKYFRQQIKLILLWELPLPCFLAQPENPKGGLWTGRL